MFSNEKKQYVGGWQNKYKTQFDTSKNCVNKEKNKTTNNNDHPSSHQFFLTPPFVITDKYVLEKQIGTGKFGVVFKGHILKTNEIIAIKMETRECKGHSSLKHESGVLRYLHDMKVENIPRVYWFGVHLTSYCLVMPFYHCSLFQYMNSNHITADAKTSTTNSREIHQWMAKRFMLKMIDIIKRIHFHKVIHRDIKPDNFMIKTQTDDIHDIDIVLIDFGLSSFCHTTDKIAECKKDNMVGTPKYMSVFIHDGFKPSFRDDLISLGYVFIWMCYGKLPWETGREHCADGWRSQSSPCSGKDEHLLRQPSADCTEYAEGYRNVMMKQMKIDTLNYLKTELVNETTTSITVILRKYLSYCYNLQPQTMPCHDGFENLFK